MNYVNSICMVFVLEISVKYCQEYKERLQKKACERYKNLSKEKKEKSCNTVVNVPKISQKMKNKCLLSIEKNIVNEEKPITIIIINY